MELENDSDVTVILYALTGEVSVLWEGHTPTKLGQLAVRFMNESIPQRAKIRWSFDPWLDMDPVKLEVIEERRGERRDRDLFLQVELDALSVSFKPEAQPDLRLLRHMHFTAGSPGDQNRVKVPQSEWIKVLDLLGYGKTKVFELHLPPPPMGTLMDAALGHIEKAQRKFNEGDYPDVLTSCRRALDEVGKVAGSGEEAHEKFIAQVLQDDKKAEAWADLWATVQKAKNFASGGPHTYWVQAADRRDAEFTLQVTLAIVGYFGKQLARHSETMRT